MKSGYADNLPTLVYTGTPGFAMMTVNTLIRLEVDVWLW